jgi:hypothetical protein
MTLTTHHLTFTATAQTPLELDEQAGSQLRGALVGALWERFCVNKAAERCAVCPLLQVCPVAALIAPMRAEGEPGSEQRPRPYVTRPPDGGRYAAGETLTFGLTLFGATASLFPYVVLAAQELAHTGLGRPLAANRGRRGLLQVTGITSMHPLTGATQPLYASDSPQVQMPELAVTGEDVAAFAASLPTDTITLQLQTPLRLIDGDRLVKRLTLRPLLQRLMRRLDDLSMAYGSGPLDIDFHALLDITERVTVVEDCTRWVDVISYSSRQRGRTPIGGLLGEITFAGDLAPLRELLVWGSLVHVGKNAVKGDGCYRVRSQESGVRS